MSKQAKRRMSRSRKKPENEPTQQTRPKGHDAEGKPAKPETIPVPKRGEFFRDLKRLADSRKGS